MKENYHDDRCGRLKGQPTEYVTCSCIFLCSVFLDARSRMYIHIFTGTITLSIYRQSSYLRQLLMGCSVNVLTETNKTLVSVDELTSTVINLLLYLVVRQ
jgi:hypothetical protein